MDTSTAFGRHRLLRNGRRRFGIFGRGGPEARPAGTPLGSVHGMAGGNALVRRRRRNGPDRTGRVVVLSTALAAVIAVGGYYAVGRNWVPGGEARRVFHRVRPSVVLIEGGGGHGSGVVLEPDGLIVTNRHVVDDMPSIAVTASVVERDRWVTRTFAKAKVIGVHPRYDAVLVKVSAPGVRFAPASLREGCVETAEVCYAIGNPGAVIGTALRNTITPGIVSAASRRIDGLAYIQTSAAVNPGNSGGALCDSAGELIGIVTFRHRYAQAISFAIPCSRLRRQDFRSPPPIESAGVATGTSPGLPAAGR